MDIQMPRTAAAAAAHAGGLVRNGGYVNSGRFSGSSRRSCAARACTRDGLIPLPTPVAQQPLQRPRQPLADGGGGRYRVQLTAPLPTT